VKEYMVEAKFYFKGVEIIVIIVYIPPNDKETAKMLQQNIITSYIKREANSQFIVMGDFNHIVDRDLDKQSQSNTAIFKSLPLHRWFKSQGFIDTFRVCNPDLRKYS
jgi:exonuclease III